jgi:hypothetical protein
VFDLAGELRLPAAPEDDGAPPAGLREPLEQPFAKDHVEFQ